MAKIAKILGRKWQLITHIIPTPKGSPCGGRVPKPEDIHSLYKGESSVYGSVVGGPELLWIFPFDSAAEIESFNHPFQSADISKHGIEEFVDSVTSSLHTFVPEASNVKAKGAAPAPAFLYNINLKLSTRGVLSPDLALLRKLGRLHEAEVYVYSSAIGGPVVTWQFPLKALGDLEKVDNPLGAVLTGAGPELGNTFTATIDRISTVLYRKLA